MQTVTQSPQNRYFHNSVKFTPTATGGGAPFPKTQGFYANNSQPFRHGQQLNQAQSIEFDGKRLRKAVARKTVDYNSAIVKYLEARTWQRDYRDRRAIQPDVGYYTEMMPPMSHLDNPVNAITTKFVRTSTNKMRCPIFCVVWTPEGRRLITGASSGEFTLWNGLTFNFETILQAHDSPVRCMVWSHNDIWMVTGDHSGYVKYWQSNMNNVKMFQAHKEPLRGISFCPTDTKFVTCSDDGTVRIWDFLRCTEEKILRGHGADVKCVAWHPQKSLIVSGSKDSQQPIKLWDPKSGQSLATLHAHKSTVMEVKWNQNGTWMLTASRDHLLKLFDIRNMSQEVQTFRGHKKEACSIAWHPIHESMFVSGGSDGSVMFWVVGAEKEVGSMEQAHDSCVWSLAWHPLGHILCTGSNDHTSKFWTRNRPGDRMRDKYNLNTLPRGQDENNEYDEPSTGLVIPGMGMEYSFNESAEGLVVEGVAENDDTPVIPGLDFGSSDDNKTSPGAQPQAQNQRKVPFSKPIPRQFQQQWMESKQPLLLAPPPPSSTTQMASPQPSPSSQTTSAPPPPLPPPPPPPPPSQTPQMMPQGQNGPPSGPMGPLPNVTGPPPPMNQEDGMMQSEMNGMGMQHMPLVPQSFQGNQPPMMQQSFPQRPPLFITSRPQEQQQQQMQSLHRGPLLGERPLHRMMMDGNNQEDPEQQQQPQQQQQHFQEMQMEGGFRIQQPFNDQGGPPPNFDSHSNNSSNNQMDGQNNSVGGRPLQQNMQFQSGNFNDFDNNQGNFPPSGGPNNRNSQQQQQQQRGQNMPPPSYHQNPNFQGDMRFQNEDNMEFQGDFNQDIRKRQWDEGPGGGEQNQSGNMGGGGGGGFGRPPDYNQNMRGGRGYMRNNSRSGPRGSQNRGRPRGGGGFRSGNRGMRGNF